MGLSLSAPPRAISRLAPVSVSLTPHIVYCIARYVLWIGAIKEKRLPKTETMNHTLRATLHAGIVDGRRIKAITSRKVVNFEKDSFRVARADSCYVAHNIYPSSTIRAPYSYTCNLHPQL